MTGEITLHGKVLAIGGLKEKSMAAYKAGIKTVLIPKENEPDISEIDEVVRNTLNFVAVERIETVLEIALVHKLQKLERQQNKTKEKIEYEQHGYTAITSEHRPNRQRVTAID
jgi:ATP-dependent Lon protease